MSSPKNINIDKVRGTFSDNLVVEMQLKGISIRKLSRATGVSVSAIVSYRNCSKEASLSRIVSLAKGIGIDPSELFEGI